MKSRAVEIRAWTLTYVIRGNVIRLGETLKEGLEEQWEDLENNAKIHLEHYYHIGFEERRAAEEILDLSQKLVSVSSAIVELKDRGRGNEELFEKVKKELGPVFYPLRKALDKHLSVHLEELSKAEEEIYGKYGANIRYVIILSLLLTLLALFIGLLVDRLFVRYLGERDRAEKSLKISEKQYRELVQNANSIVIRWDMNGNITFFNEFAQGLFGYSSDEIIGKNLVGTIVPERDSSGRDLKEMIKCIIQNPEDYAINENENISRDGRRVWTAWTNRAVYDEDGSIKEILSVGNDITRLKESEELLRNVNREISSLNRRMEKELKAAARLQQSLLPKALPDITGIEFAWVLKPCEELAGDIFNIFRLDEEDVGLFLLDVSGHGVSSALFSVALSRMLSPVPDQSSLLKTYSDNPLGFTVVPPVQVADNLNKRFPLDSIIEQYFTFFYGILNLKTVEFRYVFAGHPGFIFHPRDAEPRFIETASTPIGFAEETEYEEHSLILSQGDRLYIYSDGIPEAMNLKNEAFGLKRIISSLTEDSDLPIKDSVDFLIGRLKQWFENTRQNDDISVIALEIKETAARNV